MSRVLTTYPWYKPAGLAPRLWRACKALANAGHHVDWVAVSPPQLEHKRIHFHQLHARKRLINAMPDHHARFPWAFYMWRGSRLCKRLAQEEDVRCLLAFSYGAAFALLAARRATGKPLVIFLRSNEQQENRIKGVSPLMTVLFNHLEKRAAQAATTIVPITHALADIMAQRHGEAIRAKCQVLHNNLPTPPPDLDACRRDVLTLVGIQDPFVITANGPFNERKNFSSLIEAFSQLSNKTTRLLLLGDGPLRSAQEQQASAVGVADRVVFTGWRNDAATLTAGSDLFVLPSQAEGVSNSLLEALTADVPCLVSDIPEHVEIMPESTRFALGSSASLAQALQEAVSNKRYLEALTEDCRAAAAKLTFDWNARVVDIVRSSPPPQPLSQPVR